MKSKKSSLYPDYFTYPAMIVFGIFFILPVIAAFFMSFTNWNILRLFEPEFNGIDNFKVVLQDEYFLLATKNTLWFAVVVVACIIVIGLLLALVLNGSVLGKSFFRTMFYLPAVLSLIVVGIMFTSIFKMDGLLNSILGAVGLMSWQKDWLGNPDTAMGCIIFVQIWKWSGFSMAVFIAGLQGISADYYEAARIDGASRLQQFFKITFPMLAPSFTIVMTMNVIGSLKVFEQVYVMTGGGPGFSTQVLGTYIYSAFAKGLLGRSTAMGLLLFLFITVVALVINQALRRREVDL